MSEVPIFSAIYLYLWGVASTLSLITVIQYLIMARKKENPTEKLINYGYFAVILGLALNTLFIVATDSLLQGYYKGHTFYGSYTNYIIPYQVLFRIRFLIFYCFFRFFLFCL